LGDVQEAVKKAIERTTQSNVQDYLKATSSSHKESLFAHVLLACAFAPTDDLGYFYTADVREPLSIIKGHRYEIPAFARHLNQFCEAGRGSVLKRIGLPRQYKYRFNNPQMRPFVTMNGLAKQLIDSEAWNKLSGMN
jgi:hypothetical protein